MASRTLRYIPWRPPVLESGPVRLTARRLYILPTRAGLVYAMLMLGLLIGAINYGLSLAYLFTFWFAGLGVVGMLQTQRNLSGLVLRAQATPPVFAGETARFTLSVENPGAGPRPRVGLTHPQGAGEENDIPAHGQAELHLALPQARRGWHQPGRFAIYTRYPLGLFRCWTVLELASAEAQPWGVLVYPAPAREALPLPAPEAGDQTSQVHRGEGDDFTGLRAYQPGDPTRRIAWKALARGHAPLTKQFAGQSGGSLRLDWARVPEPGVEARLSRLARWALDAHGAGLAFELVLPGRTLPLGSGEAHLRLCLEALARHGQG